MPGLEAHGGYTFCGTAALVILGKEHMLDLKSLLVSVPSGFLLGYLFLNTLCRRIYGCVKRLMYMNISPTDILSTDKKVKVTICSCMYSQECWAFPFFPSSLKWITTPHTRDHNLIHGHAGLHTALPLRGFGLSLYYCIIGSVWFSQIT